MKVYNGEGIILGRLASIVAKDALLGEEVKVVNCEKIIISGNKVVVLAQEKRKRDRKGMPTKSKKFSRMPDRFVRKMIRGMLPWKTFRGKEAFRRIMCYNGLPAEYAQLELISLSSASVKKLPTLKYATVAEICKNLGGKFKEA